jgi:hypothetical protein
MFKIILIILCAIGMGYYAYRRGQAKTVAAARGATPAPDAFMASYFGLIPHGVLGIVAFIALWNTSVVNPGGNQFAIYDRIYFCSSIEGGRNVALAGECGRQAEITMPGFHFWPFVGVVNDVTYVDMTDVPEGHYAVLTARDGLKLDDGQVAARPWLLGENEFVNRAGKKVKGDMLDATFFLTDGMGQAGPQSIILTPKRYPINPYLWDVGIDSMVSTKEGKALSSNFIRKTVKTGFVGVVKSAIDESVVPSFMPNAGAKVNCSGQVAEERTLGQIKAVLVPVGCRGVWKVPVQTGEYFTNKFIYDVEDHDTRLQNLILAGGYKRRVIDLEVDDKGTIKQITHEEDIPVPAGAAGPAPGVKVEGWTVWQELRIQFRTKPEYAPLQAAALGQLKEVEDVIIIPQAISVLRNIGGSNIAVKNTTAFEDAKSELNALNARLEVLKDPNTDVGLNPEQRARELASVEKQVANYLLPDPTKSVTRPTRVLDFQNEREALEQLVATAIGNIGQEAGVEIVSVTFGNADIPPELLVARKVEQLSGQLRNAYTQMRTAQVQRQTTEAARARADKQKDLVEAQINVDVSKLGIEKRSNEGLAEQRYNESDAKGQQAQVNVLGADKVMTIRIANTLIEALTKNPEILSGIKLPSTVVFGANGLDGPAAILKGAFGSNDGQAQAPVTAAKR